MKDMCSQIRSHRVSPWNHRVLPWAKDFCPFRAMTWWQTHIPRALPWAKEDIALSGRAYPWRIGVHERAESPMVSIAQGNALGKCARPRIIALKGQKYIAQGNTLRFKGIYASPYCCTRTG